MFLISACSICLVDDSGIQEKLNEAIVVMNKTLQVSPRLFRRHRFPC